MVRVALGSAYPSPPGPLLFRARPAIGPLTPGPQDPAFARAAGSHQHTEARLLTTGRAPILISLDPGTVGVFPAPDQAGDVCGPLGPIPPLNLNREFAFPGSSARRFSLSGSGRCGRCRLTQSDSFRPSRARKLPGQSVIPRAGCRRRPEPTGPPQVLRRSVWQCRLFRRLYLGPPDWAVPDPPRLVIRTRSGHSRYAAGRGSLSRGVPTTLSMPSESSEDPAPVEPPGLAAQVQGVAWLTKESRPLPSPDPCRVVGKSSCSPG
jgi:hypothetical protein